MGSMEDQYKRQTILKSAQPFPSMQKRVLVVGKEEVINNLLCGDIYIFILYIINKVYVLSVDR